MIITHFNFLEHNQFGPHHFPHKNLTWIEYKYEF